MRRIVVGSRDSKLAVLQSMTVVDHINETMDDAATADENVSTDEWIFRCAETACPEDWKPRVRRIGNRFQQTVREALCA